MIALLTTSKNEHATAVHLELKSKREDCLRVDFDKGESFAFDVSHRLDGSVGELNKAFALNDIRSVFCFHPIPPDADFKGIDEIDNSLRRSGWRNALSWMENALQQCRWVNRPSSCRSSSSVATQLTIAKQEGFRIPKTLFTNDYDKFTAFQSEHLRVILKSGPLHGVNLAGRRLLASLITADELNRQELESSPCLFQEYISKLFELRVHVIGNQVLACRIESQSSSIAKIDWRNYDISHTPHSSFELNKQTADRCINVVKRLDLIFGIIDIIVTPDGEYVFLECNSQGHWIWIEELTGLPITRTIANALREC